MQIQSMNPIAAHSPEVQEGGSVRKASSTKEKKTPGEEDTAAFSQSFSQAMAQTDRKANPSAASEAGNAVESKHGKSSKGPKEGNPISKHEIAKAHEEALAENQAIDSKKGAVSSAVPHGPQVNPEETRLDRNSSGESLKKPIQASRQAKAEAAIQSQMTASNPAAAPVIANTTASATTNVATQKQSLKGGTKPIGRAAQQAPSELMGRTPHMTAGASASPATGQSVPSAMDAQLAALNGQVGSNLEGDAGDTPVPQSSSHPGASANRLSGSDYLTTLAGVREIRGARPGQGAEQTGPKIAESSKDRSARGTERTDGKQTQASVPPQEAFPKLSLARSLDPVQIGTQGALVSSQIDPAAIAATKSEPRPPIKLQGNVVPGSWAQNRLTSEALMGVAGGIQNLKADGGGEIRIRLHPEELGEIKLHVSTAGDRVGLKVQTHDMKARRILEESLQDLRDRLKDQNLTLHRVEFAVNNPLNSSELQRGAYQGADSWNQAMSGDTNGNSLGQHQSSGRGNDARSNSDGYEARESASVRAPYSQGIARPGASRAGTPAGRLDVVA